MGALFALEDMGLSRDSQHKRRKTGGHRAPLRMKRKFQMARQPAMTKLSTEKRVRVVRTRGGNRKFRALRLDTGNFSWGSEVCTRKVRILDVVYNASNNELVRTKTLVKGAIVQVDATPFRSWYEQHYGVTVARKGQSKATESASKQSGSLKRKLASRQKDRVLMGALEDQLAVGKIFARLSSRPGQSGRADGYILEGKELEFYQRKMHKK